MKSHKPSSSTRFSPILSPLPLPQHLDVQPPTYHKIPPVLWLSHARRQSIPLRSPERTPCTHHITEPPVSYCAKWWESAYSAVRWRLPSKCSALLSNFTFFFLCPFSCNTFIFQSLAQNCTVIHLPFYPCNFYLYANTFITAICFFNVRNMAFLNPAFRNKFYKSTRIVSWNIS